MGVDIQLYCARCAWCMIEKQKSRAKWRTLTHAIAGPKVFGTVYVDLVHVAGGGNVGAESRRGHTHILTMVDRLTDFCRLRPVRLKRTEEVLEQVKRLKERKAKASGRLKKDLESQIRIATLDESAAATVAWMIYKTVCLEMSRKPRVIVCDGGSEFNNALMKELGKLMKVKIAVLSAYNPRANFVERKHSTLGQRLRILTNDEIFPDKNSWDRYCTFVEHWFNNRKRANMMVSPAEIMFGSVDDLSFVQIDNEWDTAKGYEATRAPTEDELSALVWYAREFKRVQEEIAEHLAEDILTRQEKGIERHNRQARFHEFRPGDWVCVKQEARGSKAKGTASKLLLKWSGPHKVMRKHEGTNVYDVAMNRSGIVKAVNAELLGPLDRNLVARARQKTPWNHDVPVSGAYVFPNKGDVVIMASLPRLKRQKYDKMAGAKRPLKFYVGTFEKRNCDVDDNVTLQIWLHGARPASKRGRPAAAKDEFTKVYHPMWYQHTASRREVCEVQYGDGRDWAKEGYEPFCVNIDSQLLMPVSPFGFLQNRTIPMYVKKRIQQLLMNKVQTERV